MEMWNEFLAQPWSDDALLAGGALVTLFAVIRIVQSGLKMFFWVLLAALGLVAVMQGSGRAPWVSPIATISLPGVLESGRSMSMEASRLLRPGRDEADTAE